MNVGGYKRVTNWQRLLYAGGLPVGTVEIRHSVEPIAGSNLWALYAYVYPHHRLFESWREEEFVRRSDPPLHGGISFFTVHYGCVQFGCDYDHLYDEGYRRTGVDGVGRFLGDADRLSSWLVARHEEVEQ